MLEFIKDNWANILLIIVGSFALATYILQERKKKIDAASLIVLQIDEFQERLREKTLDYFVCLHRESLTSSARDKQVFFLKDGQDRQFYVLDNHFPIMQNFSRLIQSLQN